MDAGVIDSRLWVDAYFLNPELSFPVHDTVTITKYHVKESQSQVVKLPPVKYIPGFYKMTFWYFIATAICGILILYIKRKKILGIFK